MRFVGNLLWVILGGWLVWLEYVVAGLLLCLTIIGIPFGLQSFKLAGLALWPFGKDIKNNPTSLGGGAIGLLMNILWFFLAGIWISLSHIGLALGMAVTIIGIPFAIQHVKLALLALTPFGKTY